jgi:hypothetical protein
MLQALLLLSRHWQLVLLAARRPVVLQARARHLLLRAGTCCLTCLQLLLVLAVLLLLLLLLLLCLQQQLLVVLLAVPMVLLLLGVLLLRVQGMTANPLAVQQCQQVRQLGSRTTMSQVCASRHRHQQHQQLLLPRVAKAHCSSSSSRWHLLLVVQQGCLLRHLCI